MNMVCKTTRNALRSCEPSSHRDYLRNHSECMKGKLMFILGVDSNTYDHRNMICGLIEKYHREVQTRKW